MNKQTEKRHLMLSYLQNRAQYEVREKTGPLALLIQAFKNKHINFYGKVSTKTKAGRGAEI